MGQRSQVIIKTPEVYYNDNNGNNHKGRITVLHNQWLYGQSFVMAAARIVESLEHQLKRAKEDGSPVYWDKMIQHAMQYAQALSIDHVLSPFREVYDWKIPYPMSRAETFNAGDTKPLSEFESMEDFLSHFDNNNGYILIEVYGNKQKGYKVRFDLLSGLEDTPLIERKTPYAYTRLFYTDREVLDAASPEYARALQVLEGKQGNLYNVVGYLIASLKQVVTK